MDESKLERSRYDEQVQYHSRRPPCLTGCHGGAGRANLKFYRVLLNVHTYGITGGGESNEY